MSKTIAVVIIEDGVVTETITKEGEEVFVIDLDAMENGCCPLCGEELLDGESDGNVCLDCGDIDNIIFSEYGKELLD